MGTNQKEITTENLTDYLNYKEPTKGIEAGRLWLDRIYDVIKWRTEYWNGDSAWRQAHRIYRGDQWEDRNQFNDANSEFPNDRITVNITASTINDMLPFILNSNPVFNADPKLPDDVISAKIQCALLNLQWDMCSMQEQLEKAVLDWFIIGHCVTKTGYTFELQDDVRSKAKNGVITYHDIIKKEMPFLYRVNPFQFIFDINGKQRDLSSARWCCEVVFIPLFDLLANKDYKDSVINKIKDKTYNPQLMSSFKSLINQQDRDNFFDLKNYEADVQNVVVYLIHDKKYKMYYEIAGDVPEPLVEKPWPYQYLLDDEGTFPYDMAHYMDIPDEPYGVGLVGVMRDQQFEKNRKRTEGFIRGRIGGARMYAVRKGVLDPAEKEKLESGDDGTVLEVENPASDILPIPALTMNQDQLIIENMIDKDIQALTGSDALLRGSSLPSRTSAKEVQARSSIAGTKMSGKVARIKRLVRDIGYKIISHNRNNLTGDRVVQLIGQQGMFWHKFNRDDLSARIILNLTQMVKPDNDPDMIRQQAIQIFQMFTNTLPLLQQAGEPFNIGELFKWVLDKFDDKEVARFFPGQAILFNPLKQIPPQQPQQPGQPQQAQPPNPQNTPQMPMQQQAQGAVAPQSMAQGAMGQMMQQQMKGR